MNPEKRTTYLLELPETAYREAYEVQLAAVAARIAGRLPRDLVIMLEHPPVFTLGRRGGRENLLVPEGVLKARGIQIVPIERGGDITYHGPGQLVGYPIFALGEDKCGILDFVTRLEEVMIRVLKDYGITGGRNRRNRGVWVGNDKVGFVGIAIRKGVSLHGFALNVNPELSFFDISDLWSRVGSN